MEIIAIYYCCIIVVAFECVAVAAYDGKSTAKKSKCLNPPRTARRVENFIRECQEEVKTKLVHEAFQILKDEVSKEQTPHETPVDTSATATAPHPPSIAAGYVGQPSNIHYEYLDNDVDEPQRREARLVHRTRRVSDSSSTVLYHPTLVPSEDKRIAGCLLHCVYAKNNAIDQLGWPTLDGLVDFYSEGVNEHGFFMATLRSVNLCLRAVTSKYRINRRKLPERGESCDLAFDVFDCISDQITGYCMDQYK